MQTSARHASRYSTLRALTAAAVILCAAWAGAQSLQAPGQAPGQTAWSDLPHARAAAAARSEVAQVPGLEEGIAPGPLAGSWWKLKVNAKGFRVDSFTGKVSKASFKTTAYMLLVENEGGGGAPLYNYLMWTEVAPDTWLQTYSDVFFMDGVNSELSVFSYMGFDMDTFGVAAAHTGRMKVKLDNEGQLVKGNWKSLSGTVVDSTLPALGPDGVEPDGFWGSMKITGQTTSVDKLPFGIF